MKKEEKKDKNLEEALNLFCEGAPISELKGKYPEESLEIEDLCRSVAVIKCEKEKIVPQKQCCLDAVCGISAHKKGGAVSFDFFRKALVPALGLFSLAFGIYLYGIFQPAPTPSGPLAANDPQATGNVDDVIDSFNYYSSGEEEIIGNAEGEQLPDTSTIAEDYSNIYDVENY